MQKNRIFSIITIVSLCSIIFIPIGIAVMWLSTNWKKKVKILVSAVSAFIYVILILLFLLLSPSINNSGIVLPVDYSSGQTEFSTEMKSDEKADEKNNEKNIKSASREKSENSASEELKLPSSLRKQRGTDLKIILPLLFFLIIIIIIILQNLKFSKKTSEYINPYVDVNLYKLPLSENSKMPMVHFLNIQLNPNERINFATETNQKNNEGNLIITNERVFIMNRESGVIEFPLEVLDAASSVSNSVMVITSGSRKYYVFMPENQLKYALAVLRWSYSNKIAD